MNEAVQQRKRWGHPATVLLDNGDEAWSACTDAVSGKVVVFRKLFLIDSYDEAYLRAVCLDFKSTRTVRVLYFFLVLCLSWQVLVVMTPFQSVLCSRFQFIVAELGVSFCHDPV